MFDKVNVFLFTYNLLVLIQTYTNKLFFFSYFCQCRFKMSTNKIGVVSVFAIHFET